MNYYIVHHHHRFGSDNYLVYSDREPTPEEAIEAFSIDFEDDRDDEWIEISKAYPQILHLLPSI